VPGRCLETALAAPMLCCLLACLAPSAAEESGAALFVSQCGTCHVLKPEDGPRQGPNLAGIIGRKAGSVAGFSYSKGLKEAEFAWTAERLEAWLADPQGVIADTYMAYRQNDPAIRAKVVAYLKEVVQ
jgi:cytochrome c